MGKARILLADDHTLVAEAFKKLLQPEFEVLGTVTDGRTLLQVAQQLRPDVIVLDLGMPLLSGMSAGQQLKSLLPNTQIVVVTMSEEYKLASEAVGHWASGYLLKKSAGYELVTAIREVLKRHSYVTPKIENYLREEFIRHSDIDHRKVLTPRQREVLQLLAEGRTMKEVAAILRVATRTVAFHKYRIMDDFGLKTNSDLVRFAIKEHILASP